MTVLIATFDGMPDGEPGFEALDTRAAERGIDFAWAVWDDPAVDWAAADLVVVRSTWDYAVRAEEFLAWTRSLDQSRLLNGADIFEWNHDKRYLTDLAPLAAVPTRLAVVVGRVRCRDHRVRHRRRQASRQRWRCRPDRRDRPRSTAGSGRRCAATRRTRPSAARGSRSRLVESIRTLGEVSVFVLDGDGDLAGRQAPGGRRGAGARGVRRARRSGADRPGDRGRSRSLPTPG